MEFQISLFNFLYPFAVMTLIGCEIAKAEMTHSQHHWLFVYMPLTQGV